jgi:hypothetical protein
MSLWPVGENAGGSGPGWFAGEASCWSELLPVSHARRCSYTAGLVGSSKWFIPPRCAPSAISKPIRIDSIRIVSTHMSRATFVPRW